MLGNLTTFGAALALLLVCGTRAEAHHIDSAIATPNCTSSTLALHFTGGELENLPFTVTYSVTALCTDGSVNSFPGSVSGMPVGAIQGQFVGTFDVTVTQSVPLLAGRSCSITGTATLVNGNTVNVTNITGSSQFQVDCTETCMGNPHPTCMPAGGTLPNGNVCRADCTFCGDGIVNDDEQCDDGNTNNNDSCSNACRLNTCPCPSTFLNLGPAGQETVFALNTTGGKQTANFSNVTVNGDVSIAAGATLQLMAPSTINGNLFVDAAGSWSKGPGKVTGTVSTGLNLSAARQAALNASAQAAALAPNFTFGNITGNQTVTGVAGLNVVKITGNINLSDHSLTLTGPPGAFFIINLAGSLTLGGSGGIVTAGSVLPSQVLVNMTGTGALINTHVGNIINAIVLGPNVGGTIHSANGSFLLGRDFTLMSGAKVTFQPCPCNG